MTRKAPKKRTVLVALWLAGSGGRKQLTGVLNFVKSGNPWSLRLVTEPHAFTPEVIRKAEEEGIDGFIVHAGPEAAEALAQSDVPLVLIDFPPPALATRRRQVAVILDPDEDIGRCGAAYFLKLGNFASYAFVPDTANCGWSRLRERGFKSALREAGKEIRVLNERERGLADFLAGLPKPAAVMVAYDFKAKEVLEACGRLRLKVPRQVSVLGVDNDEIVCDYSTPSLSSVKIDHEAFGYESARVLAKMMSARKPRPPQRILMPVGAVVERESTAPIAPAAHLVARALAYIHAHAANGISVADVVGHLGISRRLADRRFGAATGSSIRRAIEDRRLALVKERLASTRLPVDKISRLCGYANAQRLKYVFKARFGMSMTAWRARHGAAPHGVDS